MYFVDNDCKNTKFKMFSFLLNVVWCGAACWFLWAENLPRETVTDTVNVYTMSDNTENGTIKVIYVDDRFFNLNKALGREITENQLTIKIVKQNNRGGIDFSAFGTEYFLTETDEEL